MRRQQSLRVRRSRAGRKDISTQALMVMVVLVLVMTLLSASLYAYAFYGSSYVAPKYQSAKDVAVEENQVASGMAILQIIEPPEGSK